MIQRIRKRPWMLPAMLMVLVFALGLILEAVKPVGGSAATVGEKTVDLPTDMKYEEALGSTQSTRYSGRVWADKTVYQEDVDLDLPGYEGSDIVALGDDDFLIGYSLLAATTVVSGQSVVPLDVVFVIDLSTSMAEGDRIGQTVLALNQAVKTLLNGHPDTRIAVVTYSAEAEVLLPLDHYDTNEEQDYFSLTGQGEDQILWAHVVDSEGQYVECSARMSGPTNIHMGVDIGMDLLLDADITTESGVARHPALMLMSDGAPTCSGSNESEWWNPSGTSPTIDPDVTGSYTLRAIMNAAYQKQRVTEHYSSQGEDLEMQVYTVGVGVEGSDNTGTLAQITLNPSSGLNQSSLLAERIRTAWETYRAGGEPTLGEYTFTHPESGDIDSVYYNDGYFYAENASDIANAFDQVLEKIIVSGAVPTEVNGDSSSSGYITYTDFIGEYMEVKDVKALVWDDKMYTYKTTTEGTNETTYTFIGTMTSPVYGEHWFSEILITVTTDPDTQNQTLEVKVPAALIPLRTNTVELNDDGTVSSNVCINDTPLRLFYTVGMRDDVLTDEKRVDLSKIDSEYIAEHTNEDGTVSFYANRYSGNTENQAGVEKTVGDAYISFVPADTNPFYYNQADTLLYADETCTTPAQPGAAVVYVKVSYYDGTTETFDAVARSTSYNPDDIITGSDGYLYLKAGSRCNLSDRIIDKGDGNVTQTAETYHYPIYTTDSSGAVTGIQLYLGNNGALKAEPATGDLTISKTVTGNMGETGREFTFYITLYHGGTPVGLDGSYVATLTSEQASGTEPSAEPGASSESTEEVSPQPSSDSNEVSVQFTNGKAEIKLKHGQSITIHNLPTGYVYTVWEDNPDTEERDYTVTATQNGQAIETWNDSELACTGTIQNGQNDQLAYTNKCYVPMVDFSFTKVDGLSFDSTDLDRMVTLSGAEFSLYQYIGTADDWETDQETLLDPDAVPSDKWQLKADGISNEEGVVTFAQLQAGNYRLVEVSAPDGYQLPDGQWNITVTISGEEGQEVGQFKAAAVETAPAMAQITDADQNITYYLMNYQPINPPITGGDGGEDFRIGGGLLMFTGVVLAMWWMVSSPRKRSQFL